MRDDLSAALKLTEAPPAPTVTRFLYDGDALCAELRAIIDGGLRVHVHEPGTLVPMVQTERGETFIVANDHLGMPKELVDARGRVAWAAAHSAWGRIVEERRDTGAVPIRSPFRLLGQYADEETGLHYVRFRYFDPEAGRWCSPDPLALDGGLNLCAFADAAVYATDPFGLTVLAAAPSYSPLPSPWQDLVSAAKPSQQHPPPLDLYVNPGTHDPSRRGRGYDGSKSVLPEDHVELFKSSVPLSDGRTRWAVEDTKDGRVYHRFQRHLQTGEFHWNGSTAGVTLSGRPRVIPLKHVPKCLR